MIKFLPMPAAQKFFHGEAVQRQEPFHWNRSKTNHNLDELAKKKKHLERYKVWQKDSADFWFIYLEICRFYHVFKLSKYLFRLNTKILQ